MVACANCVQEHHMLALRKEGMGVILDSDLPYLLVLNDNILSTGMKLYHLKVRHTTPQMYTTINNKTTKQCFI